MSKETEKKAKSAAPAKQKEAKGKAQESSAKELAAKKGKGFIQAGMRQK